MQGIGGELPARSAAWRRVRTLDAHTAGEPLRVVVDGLGGIPGADMLAKRRFAQRELEPLRRALMWEPRGHADMYGAIPTEPVTSDGDLGVLFLHNAGWSTMCGHGVIALATVAAECGWRAPRERDVWRLDTPAGRVRAAVERRGARAACVRFENVPSFALALDLEVDVAGCGRLRVDVAFGGAFYAFAEAARLGVRLDGRDTAGVVAAGRAVSAAVRARLAVAHPAGPSDLDFLYGTILTGPDPDGAFGRHACVFADGELDRSPTGTGVSARAALLFARGELDVGPELELSSVLGTRMGVRILRATSVGARAAVVPQLRGSAHLTGSHEFVIDPDDPLRAGFLLR
jgi:trans-L-3-hydroxyproline dehydratase